MNEILLPEYDNMTRVPQRISRDSNMPVGLSRESIVIIIFKKKTNSDLSEARSFLESIVFEEPKKHTDSFQNLPFQITM